MVPQLLDGLLAEVFLGFTQLHGARSSVLSPMSLVIVTLLVRLSWQTGQMIVFWEL